MSGFGKQPVRRFRGQFGDYCWDIRGRFTVRSMECSRKLGESMGIE